MSKEYGIEYEREVLEAFDKVRSQYGNASPTSDTIIATPNGLSKVSQEVVRSDQPVGKAVPINDPDESPDLDSIFEEFNVGEEAAAAAALGEQTAAPETAVAATRSQKNSKKGKAEERAKAKAEKKAAREARKYKTDKKGRKKKRHPILKFFLILFLLLFLAGCAAAGYVGYRVYGIIKETPDINPDNLYELLSENSVMLDSEGNLLENLYLDGLRTNIEYKDLPDNLINAFLAVEDKTFWDHKGFNIRRIFGAIYDFVSGKNASISGTSTITQQLARNLYLEETRLAHSYTRKIQEAWYTVILERSLTKTQILEAYLNTVYLGYNSNGVQAAAQAYFNKDVGELNLMESAMLAAIPQTPKKYSPLKREKLDAIEDLDSLDIVSKDDEYVVYYNPDGQNRLHLVLYLMHEQGKIDDATFEATREDSIRPYLNPGTNVNTTTETSYFTDYVRAQVLSDLQSIGGYDYDTAYKMLYSGGLIINSTLDPQIQAIMDDVYANNDNFPDVGTLTKDKQGNILYQKNNRNDPDKILLYLKSKYFTEEGDFKLTADEFKWMDSGDLCIYKGKRLNFYRVSSGGETDQQIEFKGYYEIEDNIFYSYTGGSWLIASKYKSRDGEDNLIISKDYFTDKPEAFTRNSDGSLTLSQKYFTVKERVIQPQSAMTILEYDTGYLRGMIGGRNISGKLLYNRATSTRQPGSSIKPLAVYSTALQVGYENGGPFTAAYPIDDAPIKYGNALWPSNWYKGYSGVNTLRRAVEQSINACAVNLFQQLDPYRCMMNLQNMGVSSLVTTGNVNDINASALALGGMTRGISPLEMTGAYGTFGNDGVYTEPICYTTVTNRRGDIILDRKPITHKVLDAPVAQLMTDILHTTVTRGLASGAKLKDSESAGKTGTTSEKYDIWFCGLTPKYSAAVWIGNDVNIPLRQGSDRAVAVWKKVMDQVMSLGEHEYLKFQKDQDQFVSATVCKYSGKRATELCAMDHREGVYVSDIFIKGTVPGDVCDAHKVVEICNESGYLATPLCPHTVQTVATVRPGGMSWDKMINEYRIINYSTGGSAVSRNYLPDAGYDAPEYYCPLHNPDTNAYPISWIAEEDYVSPYKVEMEFDDDGNQIVRDEEGNIIKLITPDGEEIEPPASGSEDGEGGEGQTGGEGQSQGGEGSQQTPSGGGEGQTGGEGSQQTPSGGSEGQTGGEGSQQTPSGGSEGQTGGEGGQQTPSGGSEGQTGGEGSQQTPSGGSEGQSQGGSEGGQSGQPGNNPNNESTNPATGETVYNW